MDGGRFSIFFINVMPNVVLYMMGLSSSLKCLLVMSCSIIALVYVSKGDYKTHLYVTTTAFLTWLFGTPNTYMRTQRHPSSHLVKRILKPFHVQFFSNLGAQDWGQWRAIVNTVMNLRVP
jgi:hypothetical protein